MKALAMIMAAVAVTFSGTERRVGAAAQEAVAPPAMLASDINDLLRRRCVVCHNTAKPLGGLNLQLFDAAQPDPAVALMMLVKVDMDGAMFAAGKPVPSTATIDEFLRALRGTQSEGVPGPWTVTLESAPGRGHALVVARKHSAAGEVRVTCNGATRTFESTPTQLPPNFEGLSPTVQNVFTWCLAATAPK